MANIIPTNSNVINFDDTKIFYNKNVYGENRDRQDWSLPFKKELNLLKRDL